MTHIDLFLLKEDGGFLLQENGGKIIIGSTEVQDEAGGSGGRTRQVGISAVKKQQLLSNRDVIIAKGTSLGTLLLKAPYNVTHSRLVFPIKIKMESLMRAPLIENKTVSKLTSSSHGESISPMVHSERAYIQSGIRVKEEGLSRAWVKTDQTIPEQVSQLRKEWNERATQLIKKEKINRLLMIKRILSEDIRKAPSIKVDLNTAIHQRGDLMRITANMNMQTGQIWMRIIDNKGMIVQKAGMVKTNATGFQILAGTRDLKQGKYLIQVSNHSNFSPIGVAEFQVKGNSPILPFVPIIPFLLTPDSPTQKVKRVIFKTMMDSRVDAICKVFENKKFDIKDKNLPIPPIHFNCRCHLEMTEDE